MRAEISLCGFVLAAVVSGCPGRPCATSLGPLREVSGVIVFRVAEPEFRRPQRLRLGAREYVAQTPSRSNGDPSFSIDTTALSDGFHRLEPDRGCAVELTTRNGGEAARLATSARWTRFPYAAFDPGLAPHARFQALGVAGDIDGDGLVDVVASVGDGLVHYRQSVPGVFTGARLPDGVVGMPVALGLADLDGDARPELVVVGVGTPVVFPNVGGVFGQPRSLAPEAARPFYMGVTFADLDSDGLLDVVIGQMNCEGGPNLVLHNEGALEFRDMAVELGLDATGGATFAFSVDRVGADTALQLINLREGCRPGQSQRWALDPSGDTLRPPVLEQVFQDNFTGMGTAWIDTGNSLGLDLFVSGCLVNYYYRPPIWNGDDLAWSAGLGPALNTWQQPLGAWATVLLDADADGRQDMLVTYEPQPGYDGTGTHVSLYRQWEQGRFRDLALETGLPQAPCKSAHGADLDSDGDTDLLLGCRNALLVYRNDVAVPGRGHTLRLDGGVGSRDGVHARVIAASGERRLIRGGGQPYSGGVVQESLLTGGQFRIEWPSGYVQTVMAGSEPVITVREPVRLLVTPRRVAPGATVHVELDLRGSAWESLPARFEPTAGEWATVPANVMPGFWQGDLRVPTTAGDVGVRVTVGARLLDVRPEIYVRAVP